MRTSRFRDMVRWLCLMTALLIMLSVPNATAADFVFSFLPTREVDGVVYEARPQSDLTAILLIGYDHDDEGDLSVEHTGYHNGGQSDFLLLLVVDHANEQIRQLQINRDTMTPIKLVGVNGSYLGTRTYQICLAHAYGRSQEENNRNTVWAVEKLLGIDGSNDGAKIDWYMTMDISGISRLNDLLGGVTVTIEDDFSHVDPTMVPGATIRLTGWQAERFCRGRYGVGDQTNVSRMVRQRTYLTAASDVLHSKLKENINFSRTLLNGMGIVYDTTSSLDAGFGFTTDNAGTPVEDTDSHYLMTNESLDSIVGVMARSLNYTLLPIETFEGETILGSNGYINFLPAEGAAERWTLQTFYRPLN